MVHAIFAFHRVAPAIISGGTQTALHVLTKSDVFLLHLVTESDSALDAFLHRAVAHVIEKPFKNSQRLVV